MVSPNGGSVKGRQALHERFGGRLSVNPELTRKTVSYQGSRGVPGLRWMKYKEGFSRTLVERLMDEHEPTTVLDPFAGIGTTPLVAVGRGKSATGIEIMPVGVLAGHGIAQAANGVSRADLKAAGSALIRRVESEEPAPDEFAFPHVSITEAAFPGPTEAAISKARQFISDTDDRAIVRSSCFSTSLV